jgi:hypothetical protein
MRKGAAQQESLMSNAAFDFSSARTNLDLDVASVFAERESERYALHVRYMNEMMVRVLRTIGYDVGFRSGKGPYLFDGAGERYLPVERLGRIRDWPKPSKASRGARERSRERLSQSCADGRFDIGRGPRRKAAQLHAVP